MRRNPRALLFATYRLLCVGALVLLATSASAENLKVEASIAEKGQRDSNPLMLTRGAKELYGSVTTPTVTITDNTPTTQLSAKISASENVYNQSNYNSTDGHAVTRLARQMTLWDVALGGTADYDTTRSSELTTLGFESAATRHLGYSASPEISYRLTPLNRLGLSGNYLHSEYDSTTLTDYRTMSLTPSWTHVFTPLNRGSISVLAQRYQPLDYYNGRIDTVGPSLEWVSALTPRLTARLSGGTQATRRYDGSSPGQAWQWDYVFSSNFSYNGEQDTTVLAATRAQQPYANGTEFLLTTLSLQETHKFTPALSLDVKASYQFSDSSAAAPGRLDSMWNGSAGLSYRITDRWDATTSYQYRHETLTGRSEAAQRNLIRVGFSFHTDARE